MAQFGFTYINKLDFPNEWFISFFNGSQLLPKFRFLRNKKSLLNDSNPDVGAKSFFIFIYFL